MKEINDILIEKIDYGEYDTVQDYYNAVDAYTDIIVQSVYNQANYLKTLRGVKQLDIEIRELRLGNE